MHETRERDKRLSTPPAAVAPGPNDRRDGTEVPGPEQMNIVAKISEQLFSIAAREWWIVDDEDLPVKPKPLKDRHDVTHKIRDVRHDRDQVVVAIGQHIPDEVLDLASFDTASTVTREIVTFDQNAWGPGTRHMQQRRRPVAHGDRGELE